MKKSKKFISKRIISMLIALNMGFFTIYAYYSDQSTWNTSETLNDAKSTARFIVASDVHIGLEGAAEKLDRSLAEFYKAEPNLSALVLAGDITDCGDDGQYGVLMDTLRHKVKSSTRLELTMGNHEFNSGPNDESSIQRFTQYTGSQPNTNIVLGDNPLTGTGGFHIIGISACNNSGDYTNDYEWLKQQLEEAVKEDPNKPIFLVAHHGIQDTAYGTDKWYGNFGQITGLLKQYPQIIFFSGHSHYALNDPRSIWQENYTAVQTATLGAYFGLEDGKMEGPLPAESKIASQALLVDVSSENIVTVCRMDITTGKYIGRPWVINTPECVKDPANFPYTTEKRTAVCSVPTFPDDAAVTVNKVDSRSINFTFTQGTNEEGMQADGTGNDDAFIQSYRLAIKDAAGNTVESFTTFSDFYITPMADTLTKDVTGISLVRGATYSLELYAISPFQKESAEPLKTIFTVPAD